jgi:hypothetical protein
MTGLLGGYISGLRFSAYGFLLFFFIINETEKSIFFKISKKLLIVQYLSYSAFVKLRAYRKRNRVEEKYRKNAIVIQNFLVL